jgi:hypothetical protein
MAGAVRNPRESRRTQEDRTVAIARRSTYRLEEVPKLLEQLRGPIPAAEIERRRRLAAKVDRLRDEMPEIPVQVEEWIRAEREGR